MKRRPRLHGSMIVAATAAFALPTYAGQCDLSGPMPKEAGYASWYGKKHHGRRTASGLRFDEHQLTAAHNTLPLNSLVDVTNLLNGRVVKVMITDRLGNPSLDMDLSASAANQLGMQGCGVVPVMIQPAVSKILTALP